MMKRLTSILLALLISCGVVHATPSVVSSVSSAQNSDVFAPTGHVMSLPASPTSGNLGLCAAVIDGNANGITGPSGWTTLTGFPVQDGSNQVHLAIWWKILDGTEGSTTTFTTVNTQRSVHRCYQISGWDNATVPEGTGSQNNGTTNADPPTETPTGGAKDYLWITIGGKDRGAEPFTTFPTSYTGTGEVNQSAADSAGVCIAWGQRALNASSEDPSTFSWTVTTRASVAATIAIHPSAGGGGGTVVPVFYHHYRDMKRR